MATETIATEWFADGLSFTCHQCGNCCTGPTGYVWFNRSEAAAMAELLDLDEQQFLDRFAHPVSGHWTLNEQWNAQEKGYDCVFLHRDKNGKALCSIYQARPTQCRTWPFWPENLKSEKAWRRAANKCEGMKQGLTGRGQFIAVQQIRIISDRNATS